MSQVSMKSSAAQKMGCVSLPFRCWWETAPATLEKKCNVRASAMFVRHHVSEHELCLKCFVYLLGRQSSGMVCGIVVWVSQSHLSHLLCLPSRRRRWCCLLQYNREWWRAGSDRVDSSQWRTASQDTVDTQIRGERCRQFWSMLPLMTTNSVTQRTAISVTHFNVFFFARSVSSDGCKRDQCVQKRGPWWVMCFWTRRRDQDGASSLVCFHVQENPNQKWSWRSSIRPAIKESKPSCRTSEIISSGYECGLFSKRALLRRCLRLHVSVLFRIRHRVYDFMTIFVSWHQTGFSGPRCRQGQSRWRFFSRFPAGIFWCPLFFSNEQIVVVKWRALFGVFGFYRPVIYPVVACRKSDT